MSDADADPEAEQELTLVHRLASAVSHDVRNAVTGVRGAIGIVAEGLPAASPHQQVIARAIERLDEVTARMQQLSEYATPRPLHRARVSVPELFARVQERFADDNLQLRSVDVALHADGAQLEHALGHLVENGLRYDPQGPIVLSAQMADGCVEIIVEDGGVGIREGLEERVFEPFFTTERRNVGLGLSVARRIARAHGGELVLRRRSGKGACFALRLPRAIQYAMAAIQHILCPVDFSEASEHALLYAIELAGQLDSDVHLVHAYQVPMSALPDGAVLAQPDFVPRLVAVVAGQLNELRGRYASHGVALHTHVCEGAASNGINRTASEVGADLIVMSTHGRSGVSRLLLGSVAERVVRTSKTPVLTVRAPRP